VAYGVLIALCCAWLLFYRKGQATNEMLFGGVSLGEGQQQQSLDVMTKTAERGLEVDLTQKK
jgi:hypothetical protein